MRKILLAIVGALFALSSYAYTTTMTSALRVWAEFPDTIIADGETVNYIKVYEHDDDDCVYTAFNMEFILPEGFRVNKIKQGRETVDDIFFTARATSTHMISCNIVNGVDLRIIGDSSVNADFYQDDEDGNPLDHLFTIGLIADPSLTTGTYDVRMEGIKFVFSNADARVPDYEPVYYTINVKDPTWTGIAEISIDEVDPKDCYDLYGRRVDPRQVRNTIIITKGKKYLLK